MLISSSSNSSRKKPIVWITAGSGQLGQALVNIYPNPSLFQWVITTRPTLDLQDYQSLHCFLETTQPHVIVNTAAYTNVVGAEGDGSKEAYEINVDLLKQLGNHTSHCIHISSDFVFGKDKERSTPYTDDDAPRLEDPLNYYGKTKFMGETIALEHNMLTLRTSWLYGPMQWGSSFLSKILKATKNNTPINVVTDQRGTPTSTLSLARIIYFFLERFFTTGEWYSDCINACNLGEASRYLLAERILEYYNLLDSIQLTPCCTNDLKEPVKRPHYSVLHPSKLLQIAPSLIKPWEEALQEVLSMNMPPFEIR